MYNFQVPLKPTNVSITFKWVFSCNFICHTKICKKNCQNEFRPKRSCIKSIPEIDLGLRDWVLVRQRVVVLLPPTSAPSPHRWKKLFRIFFQSKMGDRGFVFVFVFFAPHGRKFITNTYEWYVCIYVLFYPFYRCMYEWTNMSIKCFNICDISLLNCKI
jgi:hypothetical protein